jgi:hypothetical protein
MPNTKKTTTRNPPRIAHITFEPAEEDDVVYSRRDFIDSCRAGNFIDYDGYGNFARVAKPTEQGRYMVAVNQSIRPSDVLSDGFGSARPWPMWATHVVWYNR